MQYAMHVSIYFLNWKKSIENESTADSNIIVQSMETVPVASINSNCTNESNVNIASSSTNDGMVCVGIEQCCVEIIFFYLDKLRYIWIHIILISIR